MKSQPQSVYRASTCACMVSGSVVSVKSWSMPGISNACTSAGRKKKMPATTSSTSLLREIIVVASCQAAPISNFMRKFPSNLVTA